MCVSHLIAGAINTVQQSMNKSSTNTTTVPDIDGSHEDSLGVLVQLVIPPPILVWFWLLALRELAKVKKI